MMRKDNHIHIWFIELSLHATAIENLSGILRKNNIILNKYHSKSEEEFGLILVAGNSYYEQLISLLNVQLKPRNNRIIIINTSASHFTEAEVMKIFSYGAEYFYESSLIDEQYECITEKFKRWRNIESIMESPAVKKNIIGECALLKKLLRNVVEVAVYSTASVLILGEEERVKN